MDENKLAALIADEDDSLIYLADVENYELLYMNKSSKAYYGIKPEAGSYKGKKCYAVLHNLQKPCEICKNSCITESAFYKWEYCDPVKNEYFYMKSKLLLADGRKIHFEIADNATQRLREKHAMEGRLSIEETLVACIQTLTKSGGADESVERLLEILASFYQSDRAYIYEFDYETDCMSKTYEWCGSGISSEKSRHQNIPLESIGSWIKQFESNGELKILSLNDEYSEDTDIYKVLKLQKVSSMIATPMIRNEGIIGYIGVDNPKENRRKTALLRNITYFVMDDINKRRTLQVLHRLSYADALTGVYNRNKYNEQLKEFSRKFPETLGIIFADINGLKLANDTYGHQYGDELILLMVKLLKQIFEDPVYRIGGDEFVVFCPNISWEDFGSKAKKLRTLVSENDMLSLSIGARWNGGTIEIMDQLYAADKQMHLEKQSYYNSNLSGSYNHRSAMATELQASISNDEYLIYLQPIVNLANNRISGAEALIRKKAGNGGLIMPDKFVPLYERVNIVRHIDFFALERSCQILSEWMQKGYLEISIAVNFSRYTLMEHDIVESVVKICDAYQIPHSRIEIEVTEGIGKMEVADLCDLSKCFHKAGFAISMDDFGSKYANLSVLSSVSFDKIKIDRSLIDQICRKNDVRIIRHVIDLCKEMDGVSALAEGVETVAQLDILKNFKCDYAQGYYFSKPVSVEVFTQRYLSEPFLLK